MNTVDPTLPEPQEGRSELVFGSSHLMPDLVYVRPLTGGGYAVLARSPNRVGVLDTEGRCVGWSEEGQLSARLSVVVPEGDVLLLVPDLGRERVDVYERPSLRLVRSLGIDNGSGTTMGWKSDPAGRGYCLVAGAAHEPWQRGGEDDAREPLLVRALESLRLVDVALVPGSENPGMIYGPRFAWCVSADGTVAVAQGADGRLSHYRGGGLRTKRACATERTRALCRRPAGTSLYRDCRGRAASRRPLADRG